MRQLEGAWRLIEANGRSSTSEATRSAIAAYSQEFQSNLRNLNRRLQRETFKFPPARGIAIPKQGSDGKKDRNKIRPIVISTVESRVVQRSILETLGGIDGLKPYYKNPHSFGGIKKSEGVHLSAVPGAIQATLEAITNGATHVICADITGFFTKIPKKQALNIIGSAIADPEMLLFIEDAIRVELSNLAELRGRKSDFPIGEIGVAQGNSLSPLIGNIILSEFDQIMNDGDCRCIRYIDDFIILAPSARAASSKLRLAKREIAKFDMTLSVEKTSPEPVCIGSAFEFLGIEFSNGLIRPGKSARSRLISSLRSTFDKSAEAMNSPDDSSLEKNDTLVRTMSRADGILQGWGKHYWFCNDEICFSNLDGQVDDLISKYLSGYASARRKKDSSSRRREILGLHCLTQSGKAPFTWKVGA